MRPAVLQIRFLQSTDDRLPVQGAELLGGLKQGTDSLGIARGTIIIGQRVVGAAHIGAGLDGKFHQDDSLGFIAGTEQEFRPLLQGAYK